MNAQTFTDNIAQALTANAFEKTDATMLGWATMDNGDVVYDDNESITITEDLILYAVWENWSKLPTPVVKFKDDATTFKGSSSFTISSINDGSDVQYQINGGAWVTYENTAVTIMETSEVIAKATQTSWIDSDISVAKTITQQFTVTFNGNDSTSGTMNAQTFTDNIAQALTANSFERDNYLFDGWNTQADGTDKSYENSEEITVNADMELFAQWKEPPTLDQPTLSIDGALLGNEPFDFTKKITASSTTQGVTFTFKINSEETPRSYNSELGIVLWDLAVRDNCTLTIIATKAGYKEGSNTYTCNITKTEVQFEQDFSQEKTIFVKEKFPIATTTGVEKIYYKINSSTEPILYEEPLYVVSAGTEEVSVYAQKDGYSPSDAIVFTLKVIKDTISMVFAEGGTYTMGTDDYADHTPHSVTVSDFYIGEYEVMESEYKAIMGAIPVDNDNGPYEDDTYPASELSWYHAIAFCNKLSISMGLKPVYSIEGVDFETLTHDQIPGYSGTAYKVWDTVICDWSANGYRLPTEAEWEFAARGGNDSKGYIYSGSNTVGDVAWYSGNANSSVISLPINLPGQGKIRNELDLYGMSGNVAEWCWDWYDENYYANSNNATDPKGATSGLGRCLRGGGFGRPAEECTVAKRIYRFPRLDYQPYTGMRLVRSAF